MKNTQFEEAFSEVRLSLDARERILEAAEERGGAVRISRPLKIALAAVLTVCVLSGTALAVSPELRDLLWGGFEPVVQRFEPDGENTQVVNGIEARLTSAMTDGFLLKVHVELRDTTDADRVRSAYEARDTDEQGYFSCFTSLDILSSSGRVGDFSEFDVRVIERPRVLGFDDETGVLTVELTTRAFNPPEGADRVTVFIAEDILEALKDSRSQLSLFGLTPEELSKALEEMEESKAQSGEPGFAIKEPSEAPEGNQSVLEVSGAKLELSEVLEALESFRSGTTISGWGLAADIEQLPTRRAQAGGLEVVLSDIGLAIRGNGEDAGTAHDGAVALTFSDGSVSDSALLTEEQTGGLDGWIVRNIDFAAPIDAGAVTSVTVGERTLVFP